jgi:hypothetical protein
MLSMFGPHGPLGYEHVKYRKSKQNTEKKRNHSAWCSRRARGCHPGGWRTFRRFWVTDNRTFLAANNVFARATHKTTFQQAQAQAQTRTMRTMRAMPQCHNNHNSKTNTYNACDATMRAMPRCHDITKPTNAHNADAYDTPTTRCLARLVRRHT